MRVVQHMYEDIGTVVMCAVGVINKSKVKLGLRLLCAASCLQRDWTG